MKKIFVSVGLAAASAAVMPSAAIAQTVEAPTPTKWWNVSGSLRGFYDDNYSVVQDKTGSSGFEVSPQLTGNWDLQQTDIGIRYTYGLYYYVQRADSGVNPIDQTHQGDLWLDHAFTTRAKINLTDSFVVAQDPKLVEGGAISRVGGNNVANHANAGLTLDWTRQFSTVTYYGNDLYVYSDSSDGANPSAAALLNRMEQRFGNDFQWLFQPETTGFFGYQYRMARYTGDQVIYTPPTTYSDSRNFNAHYMYAGVNHVFTPSISVSARGGATYVDSYNGPQSSTSWAPYADINATYTYIPGSYLQLGFRQDINATDVSSPSPDGQPTLYQQNSVLYGTINHYFTPKLRGSLIGQYQFDEYHGGQYDGQGDNEIYTGVNLNYQISEHFAAEAGYNFDELFSNIPGRAYSRNVVYVGLGANY